MKRVYSVSVCCLLAMMMCMTSCESELQRKHIVGKWTQISLQSRINDGEPELSEDKVVWTFNDDSTYSIDDGEGMESGTWSLEDSSLVLLMEGVDSLAASSKILLCDGDSMVQQTTMETDYGLITETTKLIKE